MALSQREYAQDGVKFRITTENAARVGTIEIEILEVDGKKVQSTKDKVGFVFRKQVKNEDN